jgi:hypothetical protein
MLAAGNQQTTSAGSPDGHRAYTAGAFLSAAEDQSSYCGTGVPVLEREKQKNRRIGDPLRPASANWASGSIPSLWSRTTRQPNASRWPPGGIDKGTLAFGGA